MRTLHASFGDYLVARAPQKLPISASLGDSVIVHGCLRVMSERLRCNVSQSVCSYKPNAATQLCNIVDSLEYACLQWIYHIAALLMPSELDGDINAIFRPRFLFWLEILSVLGRVWPRAAAMMLVEAF